MRTALSVALLALAACDPTVEMRYFEVTIDAREAPELDARTPGIVVLHETWDSGRGEMITTFDVEDQVDGEAIFRTTFGHDDVALGGADFYAWIAVEGEPTDGDPPAGANVSELVRAAGSREELLPEPVLLELR